jgi:hypothetical protein
VIGAFVKFWFAPTLKNWRALRRVCRAKLPIKDQKAAE